MQYQDLFSRVKTLVAQERRIGIEILECLYEIEKFKAYAVLKYDGLYTYCVKELGFTESQAFQRIQAMRALKELPELKPMIQDGRVNVTTISKIQVHLRREKKFGVRYSKEEKFGLFQLIENQTAKQVDQTILELQGKQASVKLVIELDDEAEQLWRQFKEMVGHQTAMDDLESLKLALREGIRRFDPGAAKTKQKANEQLKAEVQVKAKVQLKAKVQSESPPSPAVKNSHERSAGDSADRDHPRVAQVKLSNPGARTRTRFIPVALKRQIYSRDQNQCTNCGSRSFLQIDHIIPLALGGQTSEDNLRLLCRSCNLHYAVKAFGPEKVRRMRQ